MQRFTIYLFLQHALHVSGGFSVHHQELKTAHPASGIYGRKNRLKHVERLTEINKL
jgi:hypothetical protein